MLSLLDKGAIEVAAAQLRIRLSPLDKDSLQVPVRYQFNTALL
jgi:hypothetical protein